jgi:SP family sugar:H+ symporter-like MFS transporter
MYQLFITLGILLASCVNLSTNHIASSASWRITIGIGLVWPLILGIGIQFLDESPRWLVRNGREDSARLALSKTYNSEADVQRELDDMQAAVSREDLQQKPGFRELFTEPTILRRFVVGMVLQMMQQLTGINYFFYFGTELFATLGVGNGYITAVILGAVNFAATFIGLWVAKRFGHREALVLGGIWIGAFLLVSLFI